MILTFSQGINTYSTTSGLPGDAQNFLVAAGTNTKVNLHAPADQPFQLAFTHRDANYLLTITNNGDISAWGYGSSSDSNAPFTSNGGSGPNSDVYYLYVDIDLATGVTSYGWSKLQPTEGSTPPQAVNPANRVTGQHWFNTVANAMFVWQASGVPPSYGRFVEKVRCFVAKYTFGGGFQSMSINAPSFIGTTVGLPVGSYRAGALIFDVNGNVLKRTDTNNKNVFFTTEDIFASGLPTSSRTRIESFVIDGIAQSPIAAFQAVYFSGLNELLPLTPNVQDNAIFGIIEQEAGAAGDLVKVTTDGVINNSAWNWANVNQQIFVDKDQPGVLTSVEDGYAPLPNQRPIAVAIDATTILLRASELLLASGGIDTFVELLDTPTTYGGASEQLVKVNAGQTGLEFGAELSNLDDVDVLTPVNGHVLYYGASALWESAATGATSGVQGWDVTLDQLAATTPTAGNALVYEGSPVAWAARDLVEADISDLQNYLLDSGSNGVVVRTALGVTKALSLATNTTNGITITNPDGQAAGNIFVDVGANLEDIAAMSAATDQFIVGQSGNFTAQTPSQVKTILSYNLSEMGDVNFTGSPATPITGDVLTYTGSEWQALPASGGGATSLASLSDVNFTGSPATPITGDVLTYTGSEWQALPASGGGGVQSRIQDVDNDSYIDVDGAGGDSDQVLIISGGQGSYALISAYVASQQADLDGGNVSVKAGDIAYTGRTGGAIRMEAGGAYNQSVTNGIGGEVEIKSGYGYNGTGTAGDIRLTTGNYAFYAGSIFLAVNSAAGPSGGAIQLNAGNAATTGGAIKLYAGNGVTTGGDVILKGGTGATPGNVLLGNVPHVWPNTDGSLGDVLTTDGSGNLSFAAPSVPSLPYDFGFQAFGMLGTAIPTIVGEVVAARAFTIAATGHQAFASVGPTGSNAVFTLYHGVAGSPSKIAIATVTFTTAGGNAQGVSFDLVGSPSVPVAVAIGEQLTMELTTADSNDVMEDVAFTVLATLV